jgi:hypothetical protein
MMPPTEERNSGSSKTVSPTSGAPTVRDSFRPNSTPLRHVDVFSVDTNRPSGTLRATYYHGKDLKNVAFPPPGSSAITLPPLPDKHSTACFSLVEKGGKRRLQPLLLRHNDEPLQLPGSVWSGVLPLGADRVKIYAAGFEGPTPTITGLTRPGWLVLSDETSKISLEAALNGEGGV